MLGEDEVDGCTVGSLEGDLDVEGKLLPCNEGLAENDG